MGKKGCFVKPQFKKKKKPLTSLSDGRTDPVLSDIGRAFGLLGVNLSELEDFVNHLEPVSFPQTTHLFPVAKSSTLQFPSPGEERRDYIPDYLPPLVSLQEGKTESSPLPIVCLFFFSLLKKTQGTDAVSLFV